MKRFLFPSFLIPRIVFAPDDGNGGGNAPDPNAGKTPDPAAAKPDAAKPDAGKPAAADDPYKWAGENLDADTKAYLEGKPYKNTGDLIKGLQGAEKLIQGNHVPAPPEDATKHGEWLKESGLGKKLGIPDEPTGYTSKPPVFDDAIKDHIAYDDDRHGRILAGAHKLNLTPAQLDGVLALYSSEIAADAQNYVTAAQADEDQMKSTLKREWGDGYDVNVRAALEVAAEVGLDETAVESLRVGKVVGSTQLTKILHELALSRGNDTLKGGGKGGGGAGGQEAAASALADFTAKNQAALTQHDHPEHASAFNRMQELKRAAGRGSKD